MFGFYSGIFFNSILSSVQKTDIYAIKSIKVKRVEKIENSNFNLDNCNYLIFKFNDFLISVSFIVEYPRSIKDVLIEFLTK